MDKSPVFLGDDLWEKLQAEAKKDGRKDIAVAYISEADSVLFGKEDRIIADLSEESVKAGRSDPKIALQGLENGTEIYSDSKLHAKVYIFQNCVIIGSANLSNNSKSMHEAGVLDSSPELRQQATEWFENNLKNRSPLTKQELKRLIPLFATERKSSTNVKRNLSLYEALETNNPILEGYVFSWWEKKPKLKDKDIKKALKEKKDPKANEILKNWKYYHWCEQLCKQSQSKVLIEEIRKTFWGTPLIWFEAKVDNKIITKFYPYLYCENYDYALFVEGMVVSIFKRDCSTPGITLNKQGVELSTALTDGFKNLTAKKRLEISNKRETSEIKLKELHEIFKKR